ncbi:DUF1549 and DUF1553 domain-containing protein [Paucibacter sp. TC2R-5]|uniref:DUF1549 and DUF1553 domain-containing protein n=1 Tax=Paucibacter sp. TC2R-5 TaxID=2893555 RepID=UPI0021E3937A|nr:DUF1549 and DUF1553 domain-containing protein [Paucibacter sp. TC2R-5]MCV2361271.1 DUF1549 and DUF1553 domain-containing protein [Paucibacter sp. TC2R-5]
MNKKKELYFSLALGLLALSSAWAAPEKAAALDAAASAKPASAKAWSVYGPVQAPAVPTVKAAQWVRSPVDAFVLAKLETAGLKPSKDAERGAYIRRATLDAWGLLPTPEEVKAFVEDKSPQAYEKLADRLLASHHFGERQARRWLDLARYADSSGFQNDTTRANNYLYRDYVINAFNKDKPFDRFVKEQIAGDELYPDDQEAKIATGFIAGYPDNNNSRDMVQRKYQIETDITDLVGETLLASTIGCARCHNHKADRVSQKEYFQLQAFFANTSFEDRAPLKEKPPVDPEFDKAQKAYQALTKDIRDKQRALTAKYTAAGVKYQKERYLTDTRDALFKPEQEWTALDRWVNFRHKHVSTDAQAAQAYLRLAGEDSNFEAHTPEVVADWKEYQKLTAELAKFDKQKPKPANEGLTNNFTTALELSKDVPPTFVRFGGVHEKPTDEVKPGIPALWLAGGAQPEIVPTDKSSGRRAALASWLTNEKNPLTARVYVNRIWSQYFDKGLITTVQDFGRAGAKPTHPELLDWLAADFVKKGWSVKQLHREILLSSAYRQSSDERQEVVKLDPENKLLAVFPRKRLEAEALRDSLLYASGQLVDKVGGPAVFPPVPKQLGAGNLWQEPRSDEESRRRSIYTFVRRSVPYPLTVNFDPANPVQPHHKRDVTTTPLQALTLFNSDVTFAWSQALAGRVINEAGKGGENAQLDRLYETLFARVPTKAERAALVAFLNQQEKLIASKGLNGGKFEVAVPTGLKQADAVGNPLRAAAFVDLVHTVANSNDFAYRF